MSYKQRVEMDPLACPSVGCMIVEEEPENIAGITDNSNSPINATIIILCPILNFTFF